MLEIRGNNFIYGWLILYFILVGLTLNNTVPYKTDESFYITSAINMVKSHNYLIPTYFGNVRFQKPILAYWLVLLGYKWFGISLWSGRLLFLVTSCFTLFLLYKFALLVLNDPEFALLNVLLLSASSIFIEFSRMAMTDLILTFFITLSLYYFYKALVYPEALRINYLMSYAAMGFAFLSKGFVGVLPFFAMLFYFLYIKPENYKKYVGHLFHPVNLAVFMLIAFPWYIYLYVSHHQELLNQAKAESSMFSLFNLKGVVESVPYYTRVIVYYFPATVLGIYLYIKKRTVLPKEFIFLLSYICAVLILFISFVELHKSRYLLVLFPALAILSSYIIYQNDLTRIMKKVAIGLFGLHMTIFLLAPYVLGEPVKELVLYWEKRQEGDLATYGLDRKDTSWAQALSHGALKEYTKGVHYLILFERTEMDKFKDYEVVKQAKLLRKIQFKGHKPVKEEREYFLIKRGPS